MRKKKILFVFLDLSGGGAQRVMLTILRHLDRKRFEPSLAVMGLRGPYVNDIPDDVPRWELGGWRKSIPLLLYLLWRIRPNTVFVTLRPINIVLIIMRFLRLIPYSRIVVREANIVSEKLKQTWNKPKLWRFLYSFFYPKADLIVCNCTYMLNDLAENFGIPRDKMVCIYNPIDIERIQHLAQQDNPFKNSGPNLVAAGSLRHSKGFDLLLDAFPQVRQVFPNAKLTILGDGSMKKELTKQCEHLGLIEYVHFAGFQDNPYRYFKNADLFILSSRYEGMPNVLLEAISCGCPVIAVDSPGGIREVMEKTGNKERLVKINEIASGIVMALNETIKKNIKNLSEFDIKTIIEKYSNCL